MTIRDDLAIVREALIDADRGPLPEHDAMCRCLSGWPDQTAKGCNCSVARNKAARQAIERIATAITKDTA